MTRCHEVRRETPVWFSTPVVVSPAMFDRLLSFDGRCRRGPSYQRCLLTADAWMLTAWGWPL